MSQNKFPSLSTVIPAYNEEKNLRRLIPSLEKQTYPRKKMEYILVDDGSTDWTRDLAKRFGMKIIPVKTRDIELNKGIGMHVAEGEFVYWLDCDMEICSSNFFELLVKPLIENKNIIGSFTKEFALDCGKSVKSSLLRFISYDELQRDPLYQFFSPSIKDVIVKENKDYFVCKFISGKIPPVGRILYRRKDLLKTDVGKIKPYIDLEATEMVARAGHRLFAYVPKAKIRHYHAETLSQLISKRLRNMERDYIPNFENKYYTWFDSTSPKDILKIIVWIVYVNLFFPEMVRGLIKMVAYKDYAFLWQPVVSMFTTDAILWGFLSKPHGRKLAIKLLKNLMKA